MKTTLCLVSLLAFFSLGACGKSGANEGPAAKRSTRTTPVCATQDCSTGKTIDDGCSADGKCLSCMNPCPGK